LDLISPPHEAGDQKTALKRSSASLGKNQQETWMCSENAICQASAFGAFSTVWVVLKCPQAISCGKLQRSEKEITQMCKERNFCILDFLLGGHDGCSSAFENNRNTSCSM
jgi:hypothetical protein